MGGACAFKALYLTSLCLHSLDRGILRELFHISSNLFMAHTCIAAPEIIYYLHRKFDHGLHVLHNCRKANYYYASSNAYFMHLSETVYVHTFCDGSDFSLGGLDSAIVSCSRTPSRPDTFIRLTVVGENCSVSLNFCL